MARVPILLLLSVLVASVFATVLPEDAPLDREPTDPIDTDEEKLQSLRDTIIGIQSQVEEIVRAFNTLQLVAKNPSLMADKPKSESNLDDREIGTGILKRRRRDDGTTPPPSDGQQHPVMPLNPGGGQSYLGPYSYPMFSGQCFLCPAGREGPRGPPGLQGRAGRDGRDGRDAVDQPDEVQPPPAEIPTRATPVSSATEQPTSPFENKEGVVYTRWGKSDCANGSELVYAGTMAGAYYSHYGSGSNWLCMPSDPIYDEVVSGTSGSRGTVYSAEYETGDGPNSMRASDEHTPTCAVCMAPQGRTSKVMIPARNVCPSDSWKLEYAGYLMSASYSNKRADYICVDRAMEVEPGSTGAQNGAILYPVEAICVTGTGLPCAPYVTGYELTCAVCTI